MSIASSQAGEFPRTSVKPLIGVVEPFDGECLMSVLARTAEKNVFTRVREMVESAGLQVLRPEFIPFTQVQAAPGLSKLLGVESGVIAGLMHPASDPERPVDKVNWYGTHLPRKFISIDRRFSPKSFASSPYIRAVWQVRPITFCPESMELLITQCPHCGAEVGWRVLHGFHVCATCGRSLRHTRPRENRVAPAVRCSGRGPSG